MSTDLADLSTTVQVGLRPIAEAGIVLGRSVDTLKRLYLKGHLPAVISSGHWLVPQTFIDMVLTSPRPGRAGSIEEAADRWFATYASDTGETPDRKAAAESHGRPERTNGADWTHVSGATSRPGPREATA